MSFNNKGMKAFLLCAVILLASISLAQHTIQVSLGMPHGLTTATKIASLLTVDADKIDGSYQYLVSDEIKEEKLISFFSALPYVTDLNINGQNVSLGSSFENLKIPFIHIKFTEGTSAESINDYAKVFQLKLRKVYRPFGQGTWYMAFPAQDMDMSMYKEALLLPEMVAEVEVQGTQRRLPND